MRTLIASSALAAALFGVPLMAAAQTGTYCLKSQSGAINCAYQTMAQCQQAKKSGDQCLSRSETTGAGSGNGMGASPSGSAPSPSPKSPSR